MAVASEESPSAFRARVRAAVEAIGRGAFQKVVVARSCEVVAESAFEAARVLTRLGAAEPDALRFSFPTAAGRFLGATPERLIRVDGDWVTADALAGSTARARDPARDLAQAAHLLESKKDQEEHFWVRDAIAGGLAPEVAAFEGLEAPRILSTGGLHHLHTPFRGRQRNASVLDLAARVHPTPAVAGAPQAAALEWLRAHEPLDRGCYAGTFGWVAADGQGALAVALRCALLRERHATVFAGAGIVAGSDPASELDETRLKMRAMLDALVEV